MLQVWRLPLRSVHMLSAHLPPPIHARVETYMHAHPLTRLLTHSPIIPSVHPYIRASINLTILLFDHASMLSSMQVFGALYSRVSPTPAAGEARLVAYSKEVGRGAC